MVFTKSLPAPKPTAAKKSEIPISRIIIFAEFVVKVTILYLGPYFANRIATISGPPAKPSFTPCGMPGIGMVSEPSNTPKNIPIKIG